jgi:hypothetical protein
MKYTNNNFTGKINNKSYKDFYAQLSELTSGTVEENIKAIEELLDDEYWTKVFLQSDEQEFVGGIKLCDLNKDDSLYSDSNIAKLVEVLGDFILSADKKKNNEDYIRTFNSRQMNNKSTDENNWLHHVEDTIGRGYTEEFTLQNSSNYKVKREYEFNHKDLKEISDLYGEQYPIINDYYECYQQARKEYKRLNELAKERKLTKDEKNSRRIWQNCIKSFKEDIIECYHSFVRPIKFKAPLPDGTGNIDWDKFDEMDKDHVRHALQIDREYLDINDDLWHILLDLENTIKQCEFTDTQAKVLKLWRQKATMEEIGKELGISKQGVEHHITAITKVITDTNFSIFEDWFYLEVARGEYRTCKCCGQVKLVSKFRKNGSNYRTTCKECEKNNRK